jgi:hypothetical protein
MAEAGRLSAAFDFLWWPGLDLEIRMINSSIINNDCRNDEGNGYFPRAFHRPRAPPMNTKAIQHGRRVAVVSGLLAVIGLSSLQAQTSLDFVPFEFSGLANVSDLDHINVEALVAPAPGGVSIGIFNQSMPGDPGVTSTNPTVTRIFFEDRAGALGNSPSVQSSSGVVSFVRNDGANLPGGNNIDFETSIAFTAAAPRPRNGLDPGESIVFFFGGSDYNSVLAGIVSGDFRVGLHVQEIGACAEDSAAFVTVIPEPGSALLGLLGALMLLRRRR